MAVKVNGSSEFRRGVPGDKLGSVRRMAQYSGQLYSFQYSSWAKHRGVEKINKDRYPLLLLAYHNGLKVWKAKNGKKYIYGFNLNYLTESRRLEVISIIQREMSEGEKLSYLKLKELLNLPTSKGTTIFRKYDIRGSKLRFLKEVDLNTYVNYLEFDVNTEDPF